MVRNRTRNVAKKDTISSNDCGIHDEITYLLLNNETVCELSKYGNENESFNLPINEIDITGANKEENNYS